MKKVTIFVLVLMVFGFMACEKTTEETVKVTILSPTEGVELNTGNSVNVKVTFTDPTELHEYEVKLTNETDSAVILDMSGHTHTKTFTIDTTFVINVTQHSEFELEATASNHSGKTDTKHVHFHVHN